MLRGQDLHLGLKVMSLPRYCFSTPLSLRQRRIILFFLRKAMILV